MEIIVLTLIVQTGIAYEILSTYLVHIKHSIWASCCQGGDIKSNTEKSGYLMGSDGTDKALWEEGREKRDT